jgi:hypothetical protein
MPISDDDFAEDLKLGHVADDYQSRDGEPRQEIIPPPRSFEDIMKSAELLTKPHDGKHLTHVLRGMAIARLDPMQRDQVFAVVKAGTGIGTVALAEYLKTARREVGELSINIPAGAPKWFSKLQLWGDTGEPKPNQYNVTVAFREAEEWRGLVKRNEFSGQIRMFREPPWPNANWSAQRDWTDDDELKATEWVQGCGINASKNVVYDAIQSVVHDYRFLRCEIFWTSSHGTARRDWITGCMITAPWIAPLIRGLSLLGF